MPSVVFVVNRALVRDARVFERRCRAAAREHGWEAALAETSPGESGLELAQQAVADGAGLVFAAGGDGTVRACAQAVAGTGVPLAIVPFGTANLTARALGIPSRADRALEVGFRGRDRRIDLACAEVGDAGRDRGRARGTEAGAEVGAGGMTFAAMAGIGLDAAVVEAAHTEGKRRLGWVAYLMSGVAHLWLPAQEFTVRLDGGEPLTRRARCVVVGNAGLLPGGFRLLPEARCDDGWLDVGILAPAGILGWPHVAGLVLTRSRRHDAQLERFRARRVEIAAEADLPRQVDGEVIAPGRTLTVSVWPKVLTVREPW
jgi:diacylglycerol kinase family enzyme